MDDTSAVATSLPATRDITGGRVRGASNPRTAPPVRGVRAGASVNAGNTDETAAASPPSGSPNRASAVGARLSYDLEDSAVIIEILDKRTGEVIQRLPPESAAERFRKMTGRANGAVLDKTA